MKVIYQKNIAEKVKDAIDKARNNGWKIEKIILTHKEWSEFCASSVVLHCAYNGVNVEVED